MPRQGKKSLYVTDDLHKRLMEEYLKHRKDLATRGITTFNGYISTVLLTHLQEIEPPDDQS